MTYSSVLALLATALALALALAAFIGGAVVALNSPAVRGFIGTHVKLHHGDNSPTSEQDTDSDTDSDSVRIDMISLEASLATSSVKSETRSSPQLTHQAADTSSIDVAALERTIADLTAENDDIRCQIADHEKRQDVWDLTYEVNSLEDTVRVNDDEIALMREEFDLLAFEKAKLEQWTRQVVDELATDNEIACAVIAELQNDKNLQLVKDHVDELEDNVRASDDEIERMQKQFSALMVENDELEMMVERIQSVTETEKEDRSSELDINEENMTGNSPDSAINIWTFPLSVHDLSSGSLGQEQSLEDGVSDASFATALEWDKEAEEVLNPDMARFFADCGLSMSVACRTA